MPNRARQVKSQRDWLGPRENTESSKPFQFQPALAMWECLVNTGSYGLIPELSQSFSMANTAYYLCGWKSSLIPHNYSHTTTCSHLVFSALSLPSMSVGERFLRFSKTTPPPPPSFPCAPLPASAPLPTASEWPGTRPGADFPALPKETLSQNVLLPSPCPVKRLLAAQISGQVGTSSRIHRDVFSRRSLWKRAHSFQWWNLLAKGSALRRGFADNLGSAANQPCESG